MWDEQVLLLTDCKLILQGDITLSRSMGDSRQRYKNSTGGYRIIFKFCQTTDTRSSPFLKKGTATLAHSFDTGSLHFKKDLEMSDKIANPPLILGVYNLSRKLITI